MKAEFTVDTREALSMQLQQAILIYQGQRSYVANSETQVHATVHDVAHFDDRAPALLPGVTADKQAIAGLLASLGESIALAGFIPHRLLFVDAATLIWWAEPGKRQVWFKSGKGIGERTAITPHPGLVFAVSQGKWFVWAIAGAGRPTPETVLHQAPYFNVYEGGHICTGNVELPKSFGIETIEGYEKAFFDSNFTHPNIHAKGKLTKYRGGATALWKSLLDGKHETFPEKSLAPGQPDTLGDLPAYLKNTPHR